MTTELQAIIDRHEARIKACGDKLMNAERDLSVVLDILANIGRTASNQLNYHNDVPRGAWDAFALYRQMPKSIASASRNAILVLKHGVFDEKVPNELHHHQCARQ